MSKIWEFFENLNEIVYASDMDTYDMIYMNKKALETYGYHSMTELAGKKCYEVLQGMSSPCAMCTNSELRPGYFKEWKYYNPVLDKPMRMKDTMVIDEGRRCRMELTLDDTVEEQQRNMINSYQSMEARANEALRVALKAPTPDISLQIILEYLGNALHGERTYIFERNEKGNDDNTYEWAAEGITPEKEHLQDLPAEVCAKWYQRFDTNQHIVIRDLEEIREKDPLQYDNLKHQNIHSLVVVPLYNDTTIIGFYGVDNPPLDFLDYASNMLQIIGHFITFSLKRRSLLKQLQIMSHHDQLTQLGNRYAMMEYLENLHPGKSLGIVYCDITGLKRENDLNGHQAGDRLILRACQSLEEVFGNYGVFRIGGDELLVLCAGIDETELQQKVETCKSLLAANSVVMAIGTVWEKECRTNVEGLLSEAEKKMYDDKAAYYEKAGIDRRR